MMLGHVDVVALYVTVMLFLSCVLQYPLVLLQVSNQELTSGSFLLCSIMPFVLQEGAMP